MISLYKTKRKINRLDELFFPAIELASVKTVSERYQTVTSRKEKTELENPKAKKKIPVVYKEDAISLSAQLGLVKTPISDYIKKIEILHLIDAGDRDLLAFYAEKYLSKYGYDDIFRQIAENRFNRLFDDKILLLNEKLGLVEYYNGRWTVTKSLGKRYSLEILTRCKEIDSSAQDLIDKINEFKTLEQIREQEFFDHITNRVIKTTKIQSEKLGGISTEKSNEQKK